jgi:hypothetical protein
VPDEDPAGDVPRLPRSKITTYHPTLAISMQVMVGPSVVPGEEVWACARYVVPPER